MLKYLTCQNNDQENPRRDHQLDMTMDVLVRQDEMSGRISLVGSCGPAHMSSVMQVDLSLGGGRVLSFTGEVFAPGRLTLWQEKEEELFTHTVKLYESQGWLTNLI
jgi:hypothetical protein